MKSIGPQPSTLMGSLAVPRRLHHPRNDSCPRPPRRIAKSEREVYKGREMRLECVDMEGRNLCSSAWAGFGPQDGQGNASSLSSHSASDPARLSLRSDHHGPHSPLRKDGFHPRCPCPCEPRLAPSAQRRPSPGYKVELSDFAIVLMLHWVSSPWRWTPSSIRPRCPRPTKTCSQ